MELSLEQLTAFVAVNRVEMVRLDHEARQLVQDTLPLLDAGRREEAAAIVSRAAELMQQVAGLMEQNRRAIMARVAAMRAATGARLPADPPLHPTGPAGRLRSR